MSARHPRTSRSSLARLAQHAQPLLESLEPRLILDSAPLPSLSNMVSAQNTVVRLETNFGDIDLELYDAAGPNGSPTAVNTVNNFLGYVRDGDYDRIFFHRLVANFVIQTGLARLSTGTAGAFGAAEIPVGPLLNNEFNAARSNIIRTIAMAKREGNPNSASSQWFINLANNASNLDGQNGGFTVFGRVLDDRSWGIVTAITSGAAAADNGSPYDQLPVRNGANTADGFTDDELVTILDAEIIKPRNVTSFYQFKYYFPEGFAGGTINEFLPISNPNGVTANFQVIVRSETAQPQPAATPGDSPDPDFWYRDKVVQTGTLGANRRGGITLSRFSAPSQNLVAQGVPYAVEVWSTLRLSVNISRYDFGTATGEAFSAAPATTWAVANVQKGGDIRDFITWDNPNDADAPINVTFYFDGQDPIVLDNITTTQAFRRGGLNINGLTQLPDGAFSAVITSTQPLIVALSHFDPGGDKFGSVSLGLSGTGQTVAILPFGNLDNGAVETISFLNTASTAAIVTLIFSFEDGTPDFTVTPSSLMLATNRRASFDPASLPALAGKSYTLRYSSGSTRIFASATHRERGDELASPLATTAATRTDFAEGFIDPARAGTDLFETISIYNPQIGVLGGFGDPANITVRFLYNDGFIVTRTLTIEAGRRSNLDVHSLAEVLAQGANNRFFFSIEVVSDVPVVAMMRHYDLTLGAGQPSGGFSTLGNQRGTVVSLSNVGA